MRLSPCGGRFTLGRTFLFGQMELDAGITPRAAPGTTSSGEPLDARSLAAQVGR